MRNIIKPRITPAEKFRRTPLRALLPILLTNIIPLAGVLFLDWAVYDIVIIYWLESVIIGLFNVLRMATAKDPSIPFPLDIFVKGFMVPFFMVHYNGFMFGQFLFILMLLGGAQEPPQSFAEGIMMMQKPLSGNIWYAAATIVISYLMSFINDFWRHEQRKTSIPLQMFLPYKRVFIQQIVIIIGAMLFFTLQIQSVFVVLLVVLKLVTDFSLISAFDPEKMKKQMEPDPK